MTKVNNLILLVKFLLEIGEFVTIKPENNNLTQMVSKLMVCPI